MGDFIKIKKSYDNRLNRLNTLKHLRAKIQYFPRSFSAEKDRFPDNAKIKAGISRFMICSH